MKQIKLGAIAIILLLIPLLVFSVPMGKKDQAEIHIKVNGKEKVITLDFSSLTRSLEKLENINIDLDGLKVFDGLKDLDIRMDKLDILDDVAEDVADAMEQVGDALENLKDIDIDIDCGKIKKEIKREMKHLNKEIKREMKHLKKEFKKQKKELLKELKDSEASA